MYLTISKNIKLILQFFHRAKSNLYHSKRHRQSKEFIYYILYLSIVILNLTLDVKMEQNNEKYND